MKRTLIFAAALLVVTPAMASVKVTNLSGKTQSVTVSHAGTNTTREIAHNQTVSFMNNEGMLSLNGAAAIATAQSVRPGPAGQLLGDLVASNRTSGIPLRNGNSYVIWPDGRLLIQKYRDRLDGF